MLKRLILKNFRCYENCTISFSSTSILVGRNNAGKSTLIEALKILSDVTRKYKNARFITPPAWVGGDSDNGISPSIERFNIQSRGVFYMYSEPPAVIEALFSNGVTIKIYVGEELSIFAQIYGRNGYPIGNCRAARDIDIPTIEVLPQISALMEKEIVVSKTTVDNNLPTRLSSRNFRNQLFYYQELFPHFKQLAEDTWEQLQVKPVESVFSDEGQLLQFYVRDNSFEAEVAWMGHGLQMWLQTMWFISRCSRQSIVVLDEPDVYMHPDLQRRLVRLVSQMFSQIIIATHSVEIMEEVPSNCIIPIDSKRKRIKPIGDHSLLVKLTEEIGSSINLDLSRLFHSKRFLIWEGEDTDRQILSTFQSVLFPRDRHPISTFPKLYVEGWGGWKRALTAAEMFNQNKISIKCYCVFDSDYHLQEDIVQREQEAFDKTINLHIWHRKEIENYVINPLVIFRYIQQNKRKGRVDEQVINEKMRELAAEMKEELVNDVAEEIRMKDLKLAIKSTIEQARNRIRNRWETNPFDILPGKTVIKKLSSWSKSNFGVSFNAINLARSFYPEEVPQEIKEVIESIIEGKPF